MQKNIISFKKLKIKIIKKEKEKKGRRNRKELKGKLHRTAKVQCRESMVYNNNKKCD